MGQLLAVCCVLAACATDIGDAGDIAAGDEEPDDPGFDVSALVANGQFRNPIIPMVMRPAGVPLSEPSNVPGPHHATEGCPDPQGLRTSSGQFFVYCTSYTFKYGRWNGFPIFMAPQVAGPYEHVGQLIPNVGASRASWPAWIVDSAGRRDGDFWGPDVHELPSGKFLAAYSAPCGSARCVGIAWAEHPAGPWTHADAPFIGPHNNGAGGGDSYDPNLLVTSLGELYFYWVVPGRGVFGAQVHAQASGKLDPVAGTDARLIADRALGQRGEGPYVVEHAGAFYEFYSSGSLFFSYYVGVRRGASPLAHFGDEDPDHVVSRNEHFVATGGNSLIQNAVGGKDVLVYHAIRVPEVGCPRHDPVYGGMVARDPDSNPLCRVQGDRQAMIDPIEWKAGADGIVWPVLANGTGTPSVGPTRLP